MRAVLIRIDAVDSGGSAAPLFLSNSNDSRVCHLDGEQWEPAIIRAPRLRYDFFGGTFRSQLVAPSTEFSISVGAITDLSSRFYAGARTRIYQGEIGADWADYVLKYDGRASNEPEVRDGRATFRAAQDDDWMDEPFLDVFAGTGGIEGPDDLTGQVKPRVFGNCRFVPGVLIDPVNVVYLVNDGPVEGINAVYDRAATLGPSTGDYADLAALIAASIPNGGWGTCHSLGLVRFGAPPDGRVAFDVSGDNESGYVRRPGEIIARVADLAGGTTNASNIAALDEAKPYHHQLSYSAQTTARQIIQSVADGVGMTAGLLWTGALFVQPLEIGVAPNVILVTDGSGNYPVTSVSVRPLSAPFWRLATNAEPTYVVYGQDEIATAYVLRGEYDAAREYRLDDAAYASDGRAFAYINTTPTSGNAPPDRPATSNEWWEQIGGATKNTGALADLDEADLDLQRANTWRQVKYGGASVIDGSSVTHSTYVGWGNRTLGPIFGQSAFMQFRLAKATDGSKKGMVGLCSDPASISGSGYVNTARFYSLDSRLFVYLHSGSLTFNTTDWDETSLCSLFWNDGELRAYLDNELLFTEAVAWTECAPVFCGFNVGAATADMRCGSYDPAIEAAVKTLDFDIGVLLPGKVQRSDGSLAGDNDLTAPELAPTGELTVTIDGVPINLGSVNASGLGVQALGFKATLPLTDPLVTGTLPESKADPALKNANQLWSEISGTGKPQDGAEVNPANLAALDGSAATKLAGIQAGAEANPADLAELDATANAKLAGIEFGATVGATPVEAAAITSAQQTADDKAKIFISDTEPVSAVAGEFWLNESLGELRRKAGSSFGDPIVDLTSAGQVTFVDPPAFVIQADRSGVTTTNLSNQKRTVIVEKGGTAQTSGVTATIASQTPGIVATQSVVSGTVEIGLTQADVSGAIVVDVSYAGVTYPRTISVNRTQAPPNSGGGSGATEFIDLNWAYVPGTTLVQVTDANKTVEADANGELKFSAAAQYDGQTGSKANLRLEYRVSGSTGAWSLAKQGTGTAIQGGDGGHFPEQGFLFLTAVTVTGLTANGLYEVRAAAKRIDGSGSIYWSNPSFTVQQPT